MPLAGGRGKEPFLNALEHFILLKMPALRGKKPSRTYDAGTLSEPK